MAKGYSKSADINRKIKIGVTRTIWENLEILDCGLDPLAAPNRVHRMGGLRRMQRAPEANSDVWPGIELGMVCVNLFRGMSDNEEYSVFKRRCQQGFMSQMGDF